MAGDQLRLTGSHVVQSVFADGLAEARAAIQLSYFASARITVMAVSTGTPRATRA